MSKTIGKYVGIDISSLVFPDKTYTIGKSPMAGPDVYVGLELEIEGFHGGRSYTGFNFTEDNSLRNHGIEAITMPTKTKFLETLLSGFYGHNKITEANYSERCSTHVHVNVLDFNLEQLACLTLVYQVFERMLFNFIGNDRGKNIFCVPWSQANINTNLVEVILNANWRGLRTWQKYTAMNLLPVQNRGTVEYRHLYGTCDVTLILNWVNLLASMHEYARGSNIEKLKAIVMDLNTSSAYDVFLQSVFGDFTHLLRTGEYKLLMEEGVIDAKLMLTKETGLLKEEIVLPFADEPIASVQRYNTLPVSEEYFEEIYQQGFDPINPVVVPQFQQMPAAPSWPATTANNQRLAEQIERIRTGAQTVRRIGSF